MNVGPLESLVLLIALLSLLGPLLAGAYLAIRLHRTQQTRP
jgi:hypothetical protein